MLVHRVLKISCQKKIFSEISKIKSILQPFQAYKKKHPTYLVYKSVNISKMPWIGNVFLKYEKQMKPFINNCFPSVSLRIIFSLKWMSATWLSG